MSLRRSQRAGDSALHLGMNLIAALLTLVANPPPATAADAGRVVIEAEGVAPKAPLFFSATVDQAIRLGAAEITGEWRVKLRVVQGRAEVLSLGLVGEGEIVDVSGAGLRDWSVRQGTAAPEVAPASRAGASRSQTPPPLLAPAQRFLDLRPALADEEDDGPRELDLVVRTRLRKPAVPGTVALLIAAPGEAVGFAAKIALQADASLDLRVTGASGLAPLADQATTGAAARAMPQFLATGEGRLEVMLTQRGAALAEAEMTGAQLTGKFIEAAGSVDFRLRGSVRAQKAGARLRVLAGRAALSEKASGDGWRAELVPVGDAFAYELVFDRDGTFAIDLGFAAAAREAGDWRALEFQMPAGAVVPLRLEGLGEGVEFQSGKAVVPAAVAQAWQGFLPADGAASLMWRRTRKTDEGALAFTSSEQAEVRVGAGLLRQSTQVSFRVLQGKLTGVRLRLDGPGEVLGVEGGNVVGWKVLPGADARFLEVRLSRPFEADGSLVVRSQVALGSFPVTAQPVRLTPEGAVRHSGFVRVANSGAVRLEVAGVEGMMQLAPAQFPGAAVEGGARQVFVYRFPSANYGYSVLASQIMAEIGVSQVVTYELTETDRVIQADLELDVREAPLRDWTLRIPADYAVVALTGNDVADYAAESAVADGARALRVLFARPVEGRQLLNLRLERNQAAGAGEWRLPGLAFPGAKSVRGHVAAVSAPGYRIVPGRVERLVEVPLSYFPKQIPGLQQAWRLREAGWSAAVQIEALGQSVQADVFHLYSLKEGVVHGSVLLNYFVVGAPANEWRIEVPESVGNIDVTGQNVRRDWRREGSQVIVSLHQPVLGAATLLVTFEQPMSARGGTIRPGEVRPLGVQGERGFIQIVSPLQVKHQVRAAEGGLLRLEPLELPAEFRLLSSSPSLAVYQYTARPFAFELGVEWYEPGETVDQVVDFAKLFSQVSRDGQVVTDARFFVKTRGRKALRMELPDGVKLWEARVDNEVVNARADGGQLLVPLPAKLNPNEPVEVALRLGQAAGGAGSSVKLVAPRMQVPTVINEWILRSDPERLLVPRGGNADLVRPTLTETGFEWISTHARSAVVLMLVLLAAGVRAVRARYGWRVPAGVLACCAAGLMALVLAVQAMSDRQVNLRELTYAASVVPAGGTVSIHVANLVEWRAMISWWGVAAGVTGAAVLAAALLRRLHEERRAPAVAGVGAMLVSGGMLAQHGGAVLFFGATGALILAGILLTGIVRWYRGSGDDDGGATDVPATGAGGATAMLAMVVALGFAGGGIPDVRAEEKPAPQPWLQEGAKAAQGIVQTWTIREKRLFAEIELTVRGGPGDSFLLLKPPAVLTDFRGDGLRVAKVERGGQAHYVVVPEREGTLTARAKFEMPVALPGPGLAVPTGPAAVQRIAIELDQGGWEFTSPAAVQVIAASGLGDNRSGATLVLAPGSEPSIALRPKSRDIAAEATQFFAETANLYLPGPGVVNGITRVTVRPAQGRLSELEFDVPAGFTVGDVLRGPVGEWRFDPARRRLHVALEPAQTAAFRFDVETQLGTGALPVALSLEPLRVIGAAGEVGMLALGFGGDAQPESVRPSGLSAVNLEDFDASLLPRTRENQPTAVLQNVWRFGRDAARVELRVASVAPEVRVVGRQVISLGDDRLVMAVDLAVAITRVGLFKLGFVLPEGLEIEAAGGAALSHWTEAEESGRRIVTLHLNGRTIGDQAFTLSLAGATLKVHDGWTVPPLLLREATRQTGELLLVPEKGVRLRVLERDNVSQLDPRAAGGMQPGTLAFRLLQEKWTVRVGIEALEPWVTVQALQEVTAREGQTLTRVALHYRVENAAVKQLRVRLPGLSEEQAGTVRGTGAAVSDFVRVQGEADVWEIRFQRGIAGETDVQIEFQGQAARAQNTETVDTPQFPGARQATLFVAVRAGGRLDLEAGEMPRGWQRIDWSAVPAFLQNRGDRSVPAMCFRVAEPESPLVLVAHRHEVADALKLRVTQGRLTTIFAPTGAFLTAIELEVDVVEKGTLRVRLPEGSQLFNTLVNGESASVVRDGAAHLFHVTPRTASDRSATVRLVHTSPPQADGRIVLAGPSLSVPLENVSWRVVLPPGHKLDHHAGALRLHDEESGGVFGIEQYQAFLITKRTADAESASALLEQANDLLQRGDQQQAGEVLNRAYNTRGLDEASNEDARVQLRALKTQQAVLSLNTRRQKLYLDNKADAVRNDQLEQAATINPILQGNTNFDAQQVDQLLLGNTAEENAALRGIATRIVDQQLATEPAPGAIDVTLLERGRVLTFTRSLQVDGGAPLELQLELVRESRTSIVFVGLVLLAAAAVTASLLHRRDAAA